MNVGSTPARVEGIRKAKRLHARQPWRPRGGPHDWGFKIVVRHGVRTRVPNKPERELMQFCLRRQEEGATFRTICNEVEAQRAAAEGRKPLAYGFQKFSEGMCRTAIAKEIALQARAELDRRLLEYIHANGLDGIPRDQVEQIEQQLLLQG